MKTCDSSRSVLMASALLLIGPPLFADNAPPVPSMSFSRGLAGEQVRLTWTAQPGVRYRISKTTGLDDWKERALVETQGTNGSWQDVEPSGGRAFFRIEPPQAEVFSVEPAVISPGGELLVRAQCLPPGAALAIEMEGMPMITVPLTPQPDGTYRAVLPAFSMPAVVTSVRVVGAGGQPIVTVNQTFEVTTSGRASDAPPVEPPGAPESGLRNDPRVLLPNIAGFSKGSSGLSAGKVSYSDISYMGPPRGGGGLSGGKVSYSDISYMGPPRGGGGLSGGKVSYSDMAITMKGYPATKSTRSVRSPGLPGEVSFQQCDLSVATPAGPPLEWVRTYRSKTRYPAAAASDYTFDFSFNVRIEPIPLAAGSNASRLYLYGGDGRRDVMVRQPDGTYRCDGMFREGHFNPDTSFTLTFADKGTWIFCPLVGAPWRGRIGSIVDRSGVALTCTYNPAGQLTSVASQFVQTGSGQNIGLSVDWTPSGLVSRVTDHTGRFVEYTYYDAASEGPGNPGDLKTVSCPQVAGQPLVASPTTYTYTTGFPDEARNHNLLTMRDGAGRLIEEFTYAETANPAALDYDTCASSNRHRSHELTGHVTLYKFEVIPPGVFPPGSYRMIGNDPLGRVTECVFDAQHRCINVREFTGFATPGVPVTSTTNRPAGQLRASDPAFFETTFAYNPDHCVTRAMAPMGSHHTMLYARELVQNCPVRERGNVRAMTLHEPGGAERTVTFDYLPGFGTGEGDGRKAGKEPYVFTRFDSGVWDDGDGGGGCTDARQRLYCRKATGKPERYDFTGGGSVWDGGDGDGGCTDSTDRRTYTGGRFSLDIDGFFQGGGSVWDGGEDGGGCTSRVSFPYGKMHVNYYKTRDDDIFVSSGWGGSGGGGAESHKLTRQEITAAYVMVHHQRPHSSSRMIPPPPWGPVDGGFCTAMTTAHGQKFTWSYDSSGNCISERSPVAGSGSDATYNSRGQCTSVTVLNGAGSSFRDECVYDAVTGFWSGVICDKTAGGGGLKLTTTFERDPLGRITRVVDPLGRDWLWEYNALSMCVYQRTPLAGASRITTSFFYDAAGRLARCDVEHRNETGALVAANPAYSTFYVYDNRARLVRVAEEERPVNASTAPPVLDPAMLGISSFAVMDFTFDDAGQCVRVSKPAASREQSTDAVFDCIFDERGLLYRGISGGLGAVTSPNVQRDYDADGAIVRATLVASGPGAVNPTATCTYDGFHRLSSITDPMGNVATYEYDEQGFVTASVYGEVNDVPGSAGNVLLARGRGHTAFDPIMLDLDYTTSPGGAMPSVKRLLPAIQKIREAKNRYRPAFFDVFVADDVWTWERFSPGQPAPHPTETAMVHRSPAGLVQNVTRNGDTLLTCAYDTAARPLSWNDGACTLVVARDQLGNVTSSTRTDHPSIGGTPDKMFTLTFAYDPLGRCASVTDSLGSVSSVARDSLDRPMVVHRPGGLDFLVSYDGNYIVGPALIPYSSLVTADVSNDGSPDVLRRSYCRSGECRSVTNSNGYTTYFTADSQGRVTQCDFPDGTHENFTYDDLGRLASQTQQDGSVRSSTYDLNGRVASDTWSNVPASIITVDPTVIQYDGLSRRVSCTQGASVLTWTYDSIGNELSGSHNGLTVTRTFNHRGRTGITYPDGTRFSEERTVHGDLLTLSAVSPAGVLISPPVVSMGYSGHRVLRDTRANGVVTVQTYRGDGDVTIPGTGTDFTTDGPVRSVISNEAGTVLSDDSVSRDRNQDVIRTDTFFAADTVANRPFRRKLFTLDRLGRVTGCTTGFRASTGVPAAIESEVTYTLDLEGNRLTTTGGLHPGVYTQSPLPPMLDQEMSQYTTWPGGPLTWNDNGSLTHMSDSTNSFDCIYDCNARLVGVNDSATGTARANYAYDGEGRRTRSSVFSSDPGTSPITTFFVYDGDDCVQELGDDGHANMTFATGGTGIGLCIISKNGTLVYPHGGGTAIGNEIQYRGHGTTLKGIARGGNGSYLMTGSTSTPVERLDSDDAGRPIFLTSDGIVRPGATTALTEYRWILRYSAAIAQSKYGRVKVQFFWDREGSRSAPAAAWCPETGFFQCLDGVYSPQLGQPVSLQKDKKKDPPPRTTGWDLGTQKKV